MTIRHVAESPCGSYGRQQFLLDLLSTGIATLLIQSIIFDFLIFYPHKNLNNGYKMEDRLLNIYQPLIFLWDLYSSRYWQYIANIIANIFNFPFPALLLLNYGLQ